MNGSIFSKSQADPKVVIDLRVTSGLFWPLRTTGGLDTDYREYTKKQTQGNLHEIKELQLLQSYTIQINCTTVL